MGKGEIARNEQFLLFRQCFLLNQITVSPFVHIYGIISLFAAELEKPKIGISGKGLYKRAVTQSRAIMFPLFSFADIELLESRVKELEENEEKKKTEICDLRKQLQAVREEVNSMERIHFRGDDLGSRIDLCPDNASLNESPKTEKTVSTPMVQTEKNKDDGRKGVHKKIKNVTVEKRRQKTDEKNKPSIKDLTRQKPEVIDNSPIEMNLPTLDTPQ